MVVQLNFLDLHYFLTTVDEMNITKAAERLFITQQSLSGRIAKLEQYFGVELFDRTASLSLTESGACLARRARQILDQKQELESEMRDIKDSENNQLSIGILSDRGTIILPTIVSKFRDAFPDVKLNLFETTTSKISEALNSGLADLAIGFPIEQDGVRSITIYQEIFVVVVPLSIFEDYFTPEEQQNMVRQESLPIDVFHNCPFLAYSQSTWLKHLFEECCSNAGITPQIVMETSNFMTRIALCFSGFGIMFAAQSFFNENTHLLDPVQRSKVKIFKIDSSDFRKDISINYLYKKYQTRSCKEFIRIARKAFETVE